MKRSKDKKKYYTWKPWYNCKEGIHMFARAVLNNTTKPKPKKQ